MWICILTSYPRRIRDGVGYVRTQLSCILLYYADDVAPKDLIQDF